MSSEVQDVCYRELRALVRALEYRLGNDEEVRLDRRGIRITRRVDDGCGGVSRLDYELAWIELEQNRIVDGRGGFLVDVVLRKMRERL